MQVYEEGTHFLIPWFERPVIYDVRTRPNTITSTSGSKDLQMVRAAAMLPCQELGRCCHVLLLALVDATRAVLQTCVAVGADVAGCSLTGCKAACPVDLQ